LGKNYRAAGYGIGIAVLIHAVDVDSGETVDYREGSCCPVTCSIRGKGTAVDVVHRPDQHAPTSNTGVKSKLVDGPTEPHIGLATAVQSDGVGVEADASGIGVGG